MTNKYVLGSLGVAVALVSLHTGCNGGSGSNQEDLRYPSGELTFTKGTAIAPQKPNFVPPSATFQATPALPDGLVLDKVTGILSGTPKAVAAKTEYKVEAGGHGFALTITVKDLAPAIGFDAKKTLNVGTPVTGLKPNITGGAVEQWTLEPKLPAGLSLNQGTGEISGTPTETSPETEYKVTAKNATGEGHATLRLTVEAALNPNPVVAPAPGPNPSPNPRPDLDPAPVDVVAPGLPPAPVNVVGPVPAPAPAPVHVVGPVPAPAPAPAPTPVPVPMPALQLTSNARVVPFGARVELDWNRLPLAPEGLLLRGRLGLEMGPVPVGGIIRPEMPVRHRTLYSLESPGGQDYALVEVAAHGMDYLAGDFGGRGLKDGHRLGSAWHQPRFIAPVGLARDDRGNTYISDPAANTIRKINQGGRVTTLAGGAGQPTGYEDLRGTTARFNSPVGLAVTPDGGVVYVADYANHAIRMVRPDGSVSTLELRGVDGSKRLNEELELQGPFAVALDGTCEHLYVVEDGTNGRLLRVDLATRCATVLALPQGLATGGNALVVSLDAQGREHLYVAAHNSHVILDVPTDQPGNARVLAGRLGEAGRADGSAAMARFNRPCGLQMGGEGRLLVADSASNAIRWVTTEATGGVPAGQVSTLFDAQAPEGNPGAGLNRPTGLVMDGEHTLLVADSGNGVLRQIETRPGQAPALRTWAGSLPARAALTDGRGPLARFARPGAITVASNGDAFVVDRDNRVIRRVTPEGQVTTWARPTVEAPFRNLTGLVAAPDGTLFATDAGANIIVRISPDGVATRFAGAMRGAEEPSLPAVDGPRLTRARFKVLRGLLRLDDGTLVVSDQSCLRRIGPVSGMVTTLAGSPTEPGFVDAPQAEARFSAPWGLAQGPDGCIYVADMGNGVIRRVSPDGREVSTWAGEAAARDGAPPRIVPMALAFGRDGWLHVVSYRRAGLDRINPRSRAIETLVEGESAPLVSDHGQLLPDGAAPVATARLVAGWGLAATRAGDLLVTICDANGYSGGVMQITEPLEAPAPNAPDPDTIAWGLEEGDLDRMFSLDGPEHQSDGGEAQGDRQPRGLGAGQGESKREAKEAPRRETVPMVPRVIAFPVQDDASAPGPSQPEPTQVGNPQPEPAPAAERVIPSPFRDSVAAPIPTVPPPPMPDGNVAPDPRVSPDPQNLIQPPAVPVITDPLGHGDLV